MSETTATVTIREVVGCTGERRFNVYSPNGNRMWSDVGVQVLTGADLPVPPLPFPDPPEGAVLFRDRFGSLWRLMDDGRMKESDLLQKWTGEHPLPRIIASPLPRIIASWIDFVIARGPVTPLIPGDPIEAPGEEK